MYQGCPPPRLITVQNAKSQFVYMCPPPKYSELLYAIFIAWRRFNVYEKIVLFGNILFFLLVVVTPPPVPCSTGSFSVSAKEGAISSLVSKETGYGYASCPITLIANLGQTFSLTLIDFESNEKV